MKAINTMKIQYGAYKGKTQSSIAPSTFLSRINSKAILGLTRCV